LPVCKCPFSRKASGIRPVLNADLSSRIWLPIGFSPGRGQKKQTYQRIFRQKIYLKFESISL